MSRFVRLLPLGLFAFAVLGRAELTIAPAMARPSDEVATETAPVTRSEAAVEPAPVSQLRAPAGVTFEPIKYEAFLKAVAKNDAKYTIVDCWASWCGPCKENFPHVLEMHKKYADKGLKVLSLSFDGGTGETELDAQEIESAKAFLTAQKAEITNYRLDEERDLMFERFDILAIPAVFVYDADGKEVKRYTWDDPSNQFTYEQVEKEVAELLGIAPE